MAMETDYHKIGVSVADTIAKIDEPLTMDQRMFLVGALSPWLKQRDDRIAELEKALRKIKDTCGNLDPLGGNRAVDIATVSLMER